MFYYRIHYFGIMEEGRRNIIKSILRFLRDEINGNNLDSEQKESIDVARQCLESTYEVYNIHSDAVDLLSLFNVKEPEVCKHFILFCLKFFLALTINCYNFIKPNC